MKLSFSWSLSLKDSRRWLAAALVFSLVMSSLTGVAQAAEETVTGIELDYDTSDYNAGTSSLEMIVEDDKVYLSVLASQSGSSSKKDVTAGATWKSSNSSIVKVDKGVLTGAGKGTATISATYKGFTASIKAASDFEYDEVTIKQDGQTAPAVIEDIKLGESLVFTLDGKKNNNETNITSGAAWSTSSSNVMTVDQGKITLVGPGTATITAKYKGKSDSVKITVTSPYKSIAIGPKATNDLLELDMGADDYMLHATVEPKIGVTHTVTNEATWTSGNTKVVTVEKGVVKAVGTGKTTITVSHLGVTDKLNVVVRTPYQSIKLSPEKEFHMQLQDAPLHIRADVLSNANVPSDITLLADWTSSDVTVATVVQGKVTPKGVGTTKIAVSHKGISRSIDVTVHPSITKLKLEKTTLDGYKGISGELPKVTAVTFDGSTIDVSKLVKWSVASDEIAELDEGKWKAKALGETTLTASAQGMTAEVKLIVHLKPLKLIADHKDMSIVTGKSAAMPKVTVVYEDGEEADISSSIEWKSNSDNIVLLENTMKGLEESTVTLTGTYLTKTVSVRVRIEEEIVKFIVEPKMIELNPGRSKSIKVTGFYKSGKKVSIGGKMNWVVKHTTIASVNGASVKALDVGATQVTGSYQGKTVEMAVVVTPKLKSLQLSSKSVHLSVGGSYNVTLQAIYYTGSPVVATQSAVWSSSQSNVATIKDGKITAVGKGTTSIKATFGGKSVTIRVTVK